MAAASEHRQITAAAIAAKRLMDKSFRIYSREYTYDDFDLADPKIIARIYPGFWEH
ncbi:hypothetical protein [Nitrosomonas supralitoralis]|uniref:hypothetical protein n=1 Tax=Nitrosomonas supralitoralis TaxID=2116706 RepID=UPI001558C1B1|nr:hypothetical protein [Nitrosomonas supralitoralis]